MAIKIPLSSITAGSLDDGALEGQINESQLSTVLVNAQFAANKYLLRMDADVGTFSDITSVVNANTATPIWGATSNMSAGDGLLISCDDDIVEIGLNVSTIGVGTWTTIELWDSTDGLTFNRQITGFTDNTGALKNSGWRSIALPSGSETGRVALRPSPLLPGEAGTSRKWILVKPSGIFTVTTAPIVSGMYVKHPTSSIKWIDITDSVNDSLTIAPTGNQFFPSVGNIVAYFTDGLPTGFEWYVFQAQAAVRTRVMKYATNAAGTIFSDVQGLSDPSSDVTDVPSTSPEKYSVRFTVPSDAVKITRTFTLSNNSTITVTNKYMWIIETTAVSSVTPTNPPLLRARVKMLGDTGTSGVIVTPQTIKRVSITRHGSATGSGDISFQLYNFTKQTSVSMVFPDTDNNLVQNYDISDMIFADGDKRGLYHQSGSRILNDLSIQYHL